MWFCQSVANSGVFATCAFLGCCKNIVNTNVLARFWGSQGKKTSHIALSCRQPGLEFLRVRDSWDKNIEVTYWAGLGFGEGQGCSKLSLVAQD